LAPGYRLPFIKAARRNEAAPTPECLAKGGPLEQRLAARIRKLVADRGILRPVRNQSPAMLARHAPPFAVNAHHQDLATRAHVVARLELRRFGEPELQRHDLGMRMDLVTATHAVEVTMPIG